MRIRSERHRVYTEKVCPAEYIIGLLFFTSHAGRTVYTLHNACSKNNAKENLIDSHVGMQRDTYKVELSKESSFNLFNFSGFGAGYSYSIASTDSTSHCASKSSPHFEAGRTFPDSPGFPSSPAPPQPPSAPGRTHDSET